jgi:hypothetical protein
MVHLIKTCLFLLLFLPLTSAFAQRSSLEITIPEGPKPWSSLDINRSDDQFQFAIVTDRTGGRRPGVFFTGVKKLNLLQPEFVMSVGDLIDGYTRDVPELDRQWEEFDSFIDSLQVPFFYTPGNHDITNEVMDSVWRARLGPTYYHFVYKDVLFMCLNSEDQYRGAGRGTISDPQYEYIKKTLEEHPDVRWTMLFMHQPLWLQNDPQRWPDVEALLANRQHTVYVGHVHHYVRYMRNNGRYYTLATTGGGSALRGPALGEFDHITWVTMTDDGPIMANLALDGIYSDDLVTETDYDFISRMSASYPLRINPILVEGDDFESGMVSMEIRNSEDQPVLVRLKPRFNFDYTFDLARDTFTVAPNSVETVEWELRSRRGARSLKDITSQALSVDMTYGQQGSQMTLPFEYQIAPEMRRSIPMVKKTPKIDGELKDWPDLPYTFGAEEAGDLNVQWGLSRDDEYLYLAAKVVDNDIRVEEGTTAAQQDYIGVIVNGEPMATSAMRKGEGWYSNSFILVVSPEEGKVPVSTFYEDRYDFEHPYKCKTTKDGYTVEMALPLSYIRELQGNNWRHVRINLAAQDWDGDSDKKPVYYWKPEWRGGNNVIGSGLFFKE